MTNQQQPLRMPPRFKVRADDGVRVEEIGSGTSLLAEITFAQEYHKRTGHKVWIIDAYDARRTAYRIERRERASKAGAR